jgi:phosphoglycolate phosphatase-like HAD superfamily hydrolase
MPPQPALLFDLDGTLVDSVYERVAPGEQVLEGAGISLAVWRIHRKTGMSGALFTQALAREVGTDVSRELSERLQDAHVEAYRRLAGRVRTTP